MSDKNTKTILGSMNVDKIGNVKLDKSMEIATRALSEEILQKRQRFINAGIPYDDIDPEMIEILDVLNFDLGIKTEYCCYGHTPQADTYIMFDENVTDQQMFRLISVTDEHIGLAGIKRTSLNKWLRTKYQRYCKQPHFPQMNWVLKIHPISEDESDRKDRLDKVTTALKELASVPGVRQKGRM